MLLTDKYTDKIFGIITCYDRMIIQGYIPRWSHADGMTSYFNANKIRIFDFASVQSILQRAGYRKPHVWIYVRVCPVRSVSTRQVHS